MTHQHFATATRGLDRDTPSMRLYEKAKRYGVWNPADIDFSQDKYHWSEFSPDEKDLVLRLTSLFQAGEEAVTLDLLPLINAVAEEGRLQEEMFLTTFLFEEAKHTDFFDRFLQEVCRVRGGLERYHTPRYRMVFYQALPQALENLQEGPSSRSQVVASATYNMVIEGVLAETGYHAYYTMLARNNLMPGVRQGITLLKQDEVRHIAYGVFLLSRLIAVDDSLWQVLEETMNDILVPAISIIGEGLAPYDPVPFGLVEQDFVDYALKQFRTRIDRIKSARGRSLEQIYRVTHSIIEQDDEEG